MGAMASRAGILCFNALRDCLVLSAVSLVQLGCVPPVARSRARGSAVHPKDLPSSFDTNCIPTHYSARHRMMTSREWTPSSK